MKKLSQLPEYSRFHVERFVKHRGISTFVRELPVAASVLAVFVGAAGGVTLAYAQSGERIDETCASDCTARGYDSEYCGTVCDVSDVVRAPPGPLIDLRCVSNCRNNGGNARDCKQSCVVGKNR
jgi:hypothetical protein